jgi:hypothetical protein
MSIEQEDKERLAYARWFAREGYRDIVRRIWWTPDDLLPALHWLEPDCVCYGKLPGTDSLCAYCDEDCRPPVGVVVYPSER